MGCILVVLGLLVPRVAMALIFLSTNWFAQAFQTTIWPVLGFVFMPYTALAWMAGNLHGGVRGGWTVLVVIAVLVDLGHLAGGGTHYRVRRKRRRKT